MGPATATATPIGTARELRVDTISDYRSFLALEPVWTALVEAAGIDHPFLSHAWVRTWWECFGAGKQLRILTVRAGNEVIAIAPLMLSHGRMNGFKLRRLQFIYNDHTPRFDFIVAHRSEDAYRTLWLYLSDQRPHWDVIELCQLPAGSRTLKELSRLAADDGFLMGLWRSTASPYLPVRGAWESYLQDLSSKHRSNLRNRLKRLGQLGQVKLEEICCGEQLESALEEGLRIEAAAWKGEAGTAILSRPDLSRFYRTLAEHAGQRGWLRLHFLTVNDRRIAFAYSLCYKNRLYLLKDGYDPEYARYSPFNLLCYTVLREAHARGLVEYDFLGAHEAWKLDWTRETRDHYWLFVFPNVPRTRLLHSIKFRLVPRLKQYPLYLALRATVLGWRNGVKSHENHRGCE